MELCEAGCTASIFFPRSSKSALSTTKPTATLALSVNQKAKAAQRDATGRGGYPGKRGVSAKGLDQSVIRYASFKNRFWDTRACFCICFLLLFFALHHAVECSKPTIGLRRKSIPVDNQNGAPPSIADAGARSVPRKRARLDSYSSFECTASGSQAFDFEVQNVDECRGYHKASDIHIRICKLRDVCIVGGFLTYYVDPDVEGRAPLFTRMEAFQDGGPACAGYLPLDCTCVPERTKVIYGPRPGNLEFMPHDRVHLLDRMSDPSNYAHLLLDTVISAYAAANIFDDPLQELQPVFLNNCTTFTDQEVHAHLREGGADYIYPGAGGKTAYDLCEEKTKDWLPLAFDHSPMFPPHQDVCFRELLVGHAHALSVGTMFPHRGVAIRQLRKRVLRKLALPKFATRPFHEHHVVVLKKVQLRTPSVGIDICDMTKRTLISVNRNANENAGISGLVKLTCFTPAKMSVEEQIRVISLATVVVTEHGSTSYLSFFQKPGTSLIVIGTKEAMALLSNTDVQTWFHPLPLARLPDGGGFSGLLKLALDRAGRRLGLPSLAQSSKTSTESLKLKV